MDIPPPVFEADSAQIVGLEAALLKYRRIANDGGWPALPAGPTIEPGSRDPRIEALATRLMATDDLLDDGRDYEEYDDDLQNAVRRFQMRHGLEQDALVGKATLRAMNVPVDKRIEQLCSNLGRTRQVFDAHQPSVLLINIPAFEAYLVRGGKPVWTTSVILGEKDAETPLFESQIRSVVMNPTWTVPRSIASEDLLPKIQNDPGFLSRGGYDVFDTEGLVVNPAAVDWAALDVNNFPFRLVQRPGPANELGQIKFLFPNPYGVCMHDTPSKYLFAYSSRAFSHGCIRLEKPLEFAEHVLADEAWTRERIDEQLESGETLSISLAEPLPMVVTYLTARVDESGTVFFYRDVYEASVLTRCPSHWIAASVFPVQMTYF